MSYTATDLVRAYKQRAVWGSKTANAKKMGITPEALRSLMRSLDRPSAKFLGTRTSHAWHMIHDKKQLTVDEHVEKINQVRAIVQAPKSLSESFEAFQADVANFIEEAVERKTRDIIKQKDARIAELEAEMSNYQVIAEVARKENRFAQLTKKFFHED